MKQHGYLFCIGVLAGLCAACSNNGAESIPALHNAVWCDIMTMPCLISGDDADAGLGPCTVPGDVLVPASVPGGDRTCFEGDSQGPHGACADVCDPGSHHLGALYTDRVNCFATVNKSSMHLASLDADGILPNGCTDSPQNEYPFMSGAGTSSVQVAGTATVTYAGATQQVLVHAGSFNVTAPDTSCTALESGCGTQVNQLELAFDDISVSDLLLKGLIIDSDGAFFTASGQSFPAPPAASFSFDIPQLTVFDAIGDIQGAFVSHGFPITTDHPTSVTINLDSGEVAFDFSFAKTLSNGNRLTISGTATTTRVVDRAPVVTLPATATFDAPGACQVAMTLDATATSPTGTPFTLAYVVDDFLLGASGSVALTVGLHQVTVVAIDSLGEQGSATEVVTVTGAANCP